MRRFFLMGLILGVSLLVGCGGAIGSKTALISGRVTDMNGLPVHGATVYTLDARTTSSSNGAYLLRQIRSADQMVRATIQIGGTTYEGQNLARTFETEQAQSVNIVLAPTSQHASLKGVARDRNGFLLQGVTVCAFGGGNLSSNKALTDESGRFVLNRLIAGITYEINAGGSGYGSDETTVTLSAGEQREIQLVLDDAGFPNLPVPQNLTALVWTSPVVTREPGIGLAVEQVKRLFDPQRASRQPQTRLTPSGNLIEVELEWDRMTGPDLLGYNIYRGTTSSGLFGLDFYREPLAGLYIDGDENLIPSATYYYQVRALGTRYPDDPTALGPASAVVSAKPLNEVTLGPVNSDPLIFSWLPGSGAEAYIVYVFDKFPALGVTSIWNNSSDPTSSLSLPYTGMSLVDGRTYYYLVLGLANDQQSRTLSTVGSFVYDN